MSFQSFTPIQYLKIDIATSFGLDKESWDARLQWFEENEQQLDQLVKKADEPAMFFAGLTAYRKAIKGESISYPVSLDATASGPQILSVLMNCRKSAANCNVIDTGKREDLYTNIPKAMMEKTQKEIKVTRAEAKAAIMPSFYGSQVEPQVVFGEGEMLDLFYDTMEEETPGAWMLNQELLALWRSDVLSHNWVLPDGFHVHDKVMDIREETIEFDGELFDVVTKVNRPVEKGRSIGANTVHSIDGMVVREILRRCWYSPTQVLKVLELLQTPPVLADTSKSDRRNYRMVSKLMAYAEDSGFISARVLDFIDEHSIQALTMDEREMVAQLIQSLPEKPFPVLSIHDCFRVHPNYGNDLRRQYNLMLSLIARSRLLEFIASQIAGEHMPVNKMGDIADEILEANYALS